MKWPEVDKMKLKELLQIYCKRMKEIRKISLQLNKEYTQSKWNMRARRYNICKAVEEELWEKALMIKK